MYSRTPIYIYRQTDKQTETETERELWTYTGVRSVVDELMTYLNTQAHISTSKSADMQGLFYSSCLNTRYLAI